MQERNRIALVINAFCAHAELTRVLRPEEDRRNSLVNAPNAAELSRVAQMLRSGLATFDRKIGG